MLLQYNTFLILASVIVVSFNCGQNKASENYNKADTVSAKQNPAKQDSLEQKEKPHDSPVTVDIPDVHRFIVARRTGVTRGTENEYEILLRDSDGRNLQILAKRLFCRFTDNDLVWLGERNSIAYIGKPDYDSSEGLWIYDYKNNIERQLVDAEIGMGCVEIAKDRQHLFYITGGSWYKVNIETGKKRFLIEISSRGGAAKINPEGTIVGGCAERSFYVIDLKTKKRYEWAVGDSFFNQLNIVRFSRNFNFVYYEIFHPKNSYYESFVSPLQPGKELNPKKIHDDDLLTNYEYLTVDGKYLYRRSFFSHRVNTLTDTVAEIPTFGFANPTHLIEE